MRHDRWWIRKGSWTKIRRMDVCWNLWNSKVSNLQDPSRRLANEWLLEASSSWSQAGTMQVATSRDSRNFYRKHERCTPKEGDFHASDFFSEKKWNSAFLVKIFFWAAENLHGGTLWYFQNLFFIRHSDWKEQCAFKSAYAQFSILSIFLKLEFFDVITASSSV